MFAEQTQAKANAHAVVAVVQADVDARRARRAKAEARQATDAAAAARQATDAAATARQANAAAAAAAAATTAAAATLAATAGLPSVPAASEEVASTADVLHWQNQVASKFSRIYTEILGVKSTLDSILLSVAGLRDAVTGGASKTADVEVLLQQFMDNFADREPLAGQRGREEVSRPELAAN